MSGATTSLTSPAEIAAYTSLPAPERAPDRLAALGRVYGLDPAPVEGCRVLELGAGTGSDLIAMAQGFPESSFLGIDLSPAMVEQGRLSAAELGLCNVEFEERSILDFRRRAGSFDYILCHGVFSWVPPDVQKKILQICSRHLAHNGLACISYNAMPGWTHRAVLRDALKRFVPEASGADAVQQARAAIDLMLQALQDAASPYAMALQLELDNSKRSSDPFIFQELLAGGVSAFYLDEFVERAARHGLRYLSEARFELIRSERIEEFENATELRAVLGQVADRHKREQLLDFLFPTPLRQAVLTRASTPSSAPAPDALKQLWIASALVPAETGTEEFVSPRGVSVVVRDRLLNRALRELIAAWPSWVPVSELYQRTSNGDEDGFSSFARGLLTLYSRGVVELHSVAPRFTAAVPALPEVAPFARRQLRQQKWATNLRHEYTVLTDIEQQVALLADGTRDKQQIVEALAASLASGGLELRAEYQEAAAGQRMEGLLEQAAEESLARFAENALLVSWPAGRESRPQNKRRAFSKFFRR